MRYVLLALLIAVAGFGVWLAVQPTPIEPLGWDAPANPGLTGVYKPNEALKGATLASVAPGRGPEDVAFGPAGFVYTGLENGDIVRLRADGSTPPQKIANTGGRPLGLEFASDGLLLVADARRGLLAVTPDGKVSVLAVRARGKPIAFANDLAIATDGTVYFSDASSRGYEGLPLDAWEANPTGRLLAYDPLSGETRVLLEGLQLANGVALGPNEEYVLVAETFAYRVRRYWLKGPNAGKDDVFIDGLPGFPDNLSYDGAGRFWIALVSPRNDTLDALAGRPILRKMLFNLYRLIGFPAAGPKYGWIVAVGTNGLVEGNLQDPAGRVHDVTSVNRYGDTLVLGSLTMTALATIPAPPP
ncbi:MAG: SMP-30/gluconolactonase/LRE family protein [Alphaproteobacteria bacterium]|nr:SMP-30/gluconolactonase/LRE family protein [Alphaproteobacteria bacterium]